MEKQQHPLTVTAIGNCTHKRSQKHTKMLYEHTTKPTSTHSHSTAGNGLTKLNKWNHCDLNERQSSSDIQKCTILSPSFHQFISRPSVSFGLCLCWGHPQTPPFLFVSSPLMSLFFTFAFRYTPFPLMCFFFSSLWSQCEICAGTSRSVTLL